jgi:hypothetical protein
MRRINHHIILCSLAFLICMSSGTAATDDDPVFMAMSDELTRSMERLTLENMAGPYFLSYMIQDLEELVISARCGALIRTTDSVTRYLYVQLRVGAPDMDNHNFIGSWRDLYNRRKEIAEEDDYGSIRHALWLRTDRAYKHALENLARKKAYLKAHPVKTPVPDFSPAPRFIHPGDMVELGGDGGEWKGTVKTAADIFNDFAALHDWKVEYRALADNRRYVNSEQSKYRKGEIYRILEISATSKADDGQRLTGFIRYVTRNSDKPPAETMLFDDIREMAGELEMMTAASPLDEYAGPVLFSDYAAAQLISQLFAAQLSPVQKPITTEDWMRERFSAGKFPGRLQRRIFPRDVSMYDRPDCKWHEGHLLAGYREVDDEGVKSESIALVKKGRLIDLPMGRQPARKLRESNGHAITLENQWTVQGITNLFVESDNPLSEKKMMKKMMDMCREGGNEYGLLITLLDDPRISKPYAWIDEARDTDRPLLTMPVIAYRIFEEDGRKEPVRGLVFDEVTIRTLKDIAAIGKESLVFNILQRSPFPDITYPATIITPPILVEDMELKGVSLYEPLPIGTNPVFPRDEACDRAAAQ